MRDDSCLEAAFAALADARDIALATALLSLVQAITTHAPDGMSKSKLRKRMIGLGFADVLMTHAVRLLATVEAPVAEPASSSVSNDTDKVITVDSASNCHSNACRVAARSGSTENVSPIGSKPLADSGFVR